MKQAHADRQLILAYLAKPDTFDKQAAHLFFLRFPEDDDSDAIWKALEERLHSRAAKNLPHNPFGPRGNKILQRRYIIFRSGRYEHDKERSINLARRLVIAQPYDPEKWARAAGEHSVHPSEMTDHDAYGENANHYS